MTEPRRPELVSGPLSDLDVDVVAFCVSGEEGVPAPPAAFDERLGGPVRRAREQGSLRTKAGASLFVATGEEAGPHLLAIGVGDDPPDARAFRRAAGTAIREARRRRCRSVAFVVPGPGADVAGAAVEGLELGDWSYDELRRAGADDERAPRPERAALHVPDPGAVDRTSIERAAELADGQNFARGLVARPGNVATPTFLADRAETLADDASLEVEVWGPGRLRAEGFGALLAVARGSSEEPRFLILRHRGADEDPTVLVGKGVTFDSGGISLKPSDGMHEMKYDMAGAAAVLGALRAAGRTELERHVVGLVPTTENLPSGSALKPGDVIEGVSGTTIEVVNTDAEGRLILSDALAYAARLGPAAVVDLATLTGSCVVALGHHAAGLMSPDDDLAEALLAAGEATDERLWRLPLWREYREQLDSDVADIKNSGGRPAGAITAGMFLKEFVGDVPWAHLDIAGTAWADEDRSHQPEGATGVGVRLLLGWLRSSG